jgi:hypothetical protein
LFLLILPDEVVEDVVAMAYDEKEEKEMEAAKEDAPKKKAEAVAENLYCRGSRRGHSRQMLTNYKKSLMLW